MVIAVELNNPGVFWAGNAHHIGIFLGAVVDRLLDAIIQRMDLQGKKCGVAKRDELNAKFR